MVGSEKLSYLPGPLVAFLRDCGANVE